MPPRRTLPLLVAAFAVAARNAHASVPYVTDDGEINETGHVEIDVPGQFTHRSGETSGVLPSLDLEYGALPGVQLHLFAPLALDHVDGGRARWGVGDLEVGAKYDLSETHHLLLSLGRGLQNPRPTNQGSAYLGLQATL